MFLREGASASVTAIARQLGVTPAAIFHRRGPRAALFEWTFSRQPPAGSLAPRRGLAAGAPVGDAGVSCDCLLRALEARHLRAFLLGACSGVAEDRAYLQELVAKLQRSGNS